VRFYAFLSELLPPSKSPLCIRTYPPIFHYGKTWGPLNVYRAVPRVTFDLRTKSLTTQVKNLIKLFIRKYNCLRAFLRFDSIINRDKAQKGSLHQLF